MTYCVAVNLNAGVVMLADSRANAGIDNISTFSKLFTWSAPAGSANQRAVAIMTSGHLSVTQEIIALIEEENAANGPNQDQGLRTVLSEPSMFRVASRVGEIMADVQSRRRPQLGSSSSATLILGGQVGSEPTRLFIIHDLGNFHEATVDTPFLQIGELKYGKPILDRMVDPGMALADGVKATMLSMDATLRSNLSVGLPLDIAVTSPGAHAWRTRRIEGSDPTYLQIREAWPAHLRSGFRAMPDLPL